MVSFESLDTVSYSHSIATVAVSTQYTNATDRHTPHGGIGRDYAQRRAAKILSQEARRFDLLVHFSGSAAAVVRLELHVYE